MLDPLAFKAVSYGLILLLAFTGLILSLLSLRKEYAADTPLSGLFPLVLIIASLCGFMWGLTFFLDAQQRFATFLKSERTAVSSTE